MSEAHRALVAERVQMQRRAVGKKKAPVVSAPDPSPTLVPRRRTTTTSSTSSDQQSISPTPLRKQSSSSVNSGSSSAKPKFDERNYVPCRYFAAGGNCRDGDKCPFSHHPDLIGIFSGGAVPQDVFSPSQRPAPQPKRSSSKKPSGAKKKRSPSQTRQQVGDAMNVDGMSYEQLTDLCDRMGKVKVGVDKSILDTLPCITVKTITTEKCAICLEVFNIGDEMKILPCSHPFHPDCINEWLDGSKKCPNCNEEITTTTSSNNISENTTTTETEKDSRDRGVNHSVLSSSQYDTPPPAVRPGLAPASNTSNGGATNVVRRLPISNTTSTPVALPPLANRYSPERTAVARTSPPPMVPTSSAGSSTTTAGGRTPLVFSSAAAVLASLADDP